MGEKNFNSTQGEGNKDCQPPQILKVGLPKLTYTNEEQQNIYESVKAQVRGFYLPIMVLEDIKLETII